MSEDYFERADRLYKERQEEEVLQNLEKGGSK